MTVVLRVEGQPLLGHHAHEADGIAGIPVALIEDVEGRLTACAQVLQKCLGDLQLVCALGIGGIQQKQDDIGVDRLLQSGAEGRDQMVGELTDEADGVGEEDGLSPGEGEFSRGGVQGGEELVLGQDPRACEGIEQGGFSCVGVAHDGHAGQSRAVAGGTHGAAVLLHHLQLGLEGVDAPLHVAAVALQLGLTGAPRADTAAQSGHLGTVTRQSRGGVLKLGQLHLQFPLGGDGVEGEDIQDQHGAVDHAKLHFTVAPADIVLQIADLDGGEVAVEDH